MQTTENTASAHFAEGTTHIIITDLTISDREIVREAQRWTQGHRGSIVEDAEILANADLAPFVEEALKIGAKAISITGQVHEAAELERIVKEVGATTVEATAKAAEATGRVVQEASQTLRKAAADAKQAIVEADRESRRELTDAVAQAKKGLSDTLLQLLGGENPELLARLQPALDKFSTDLSFKAQVATDELIAKAVKQFDSNDPSSPMAKHTATLAAQQTSLAEQLGKNHTDLIAKVDELATAIKVQEARSQMAKVTPLKGGDYEDQINAVMDGIATGLGDEYTDTRLFAGNLPRNKKGDGVLTINGGAARLVLEMTDSPRTAWNDYLDEAERNRGAVVSLGLVRCAAQNGGHSFRTFSSRRIVMAFDPEQDDPEFLRTVVMLLRAAALAAATRTGASEIATVEEKLTAAMAQLDALGDVRKTAGAIRNHAEKVDTQCGKIDTGIRRLLSEALDALSGVGADPVTPSHAA